MNLNMANYLKYKKVLNIKKFCVLYANYNQQVWKTSYKLEKIICNVIQH